MQTYVIFDKETGEILHIHSIDGGDSLEKEVIRSLLLEGLPEPEKVDILPVGNQPLDLRRMRVNRTERKLERIPGRK